LAKHASLLSGTEHADKALQVLHGVSGVLGVWRVEFWASWDVRELVLRQNNPVVYGFMYFVS